ncbi:MAG: 2-hydroxyacid dehydrogenase [Armatimonadetes bacterium]|nr:2-hydroxyacid dehydrogenase [Akkermansiaceae bacterium]
MSDELPERGRVAFYDTKSYARVYFDAAGAAGGMEIVYQEFRLEAANAFTAEGGVAACVFVNDKVDRRCLEALAGIGVGLVALRCAGFNNVDVKAAGELGLTVVRVPAYSPHAVAEHAVALLLTLNRKIHRAYNRVRELNFSLGGLVGFDLFEKRVGIVGTGKIGRIAAQIFRGFGCEVIAYDPFPQVEWAQANGVEYAGFEELMRTCDVVSLHLPLTPETHHLLNAESISRMKKGAYLINTSRGKLVDSAAVIQALKSGQLGGVALDVYEEEEGVFFEDHSETALQDDVLARLLTFPNVLVTSHQAFLTEEALRAIAETTMDSIGRFARGEAAVAERVVK